MDIFQRVGWLCWRVGYQGLIKGQLGRIPEGGTAVLAGGYLSRAYKGTTRDDLKILGLLRHSAGFIRVIRVNVSVCRGYWCYCSTRVIVTVCRVTGVIVVLGLL